MDMFHTRQRHLSRYRRHGDATDEMISIDTDALRLSYAQDDSSSLEVIHWFVFVNGFGRRITQTRLSKRTFADANHIISPGPGRPCVRKDASSYKWNNRLPVDAVTIILPI